MVFTNRFEGFYHQKPIHLYILSPGLPIGCWDHFQQIITTAPMNGKLLRILKKLEEETRSLKDRIVLSAEATAAHESLTFCRADSLIRFWVEALNLISLIVLG